MEKEKDIEPGQRSEDLDKVFQLQSREKMQHRATLKETISSGNRGINSHWIDIPCVQLVPHRHAPQICHKARSAPKSPAAPRGTQAFFSIPLSPHLDVSPCAAAQNL